jgi:hypothetical protein
MENDRGSRPMSGSSQHERVTTVKLFFLRYSFILLSEIIQAENLVLAELLNPAEFFNNFKTIQNLWFFGTPCEHP